MDEIKIVLTGDIASNKNSLVARLSNGIITYVRNIPYKVLHNKTLTNKTIMGMAKYCRVTHNKKYKAWCIEAEKQILSQMEYEPFFDKVSIDWYFYFSKEGISGGDITNKMQSVEDALTRCNIIDDDHYQCHKKGTYDSEFRKGLGGCEVIIKRIK